MRAPGQFGLRKTWRPPGQATNHIESIWAVSLAGQTPHLLAQATAPELSRRPVHIGTSDSFAGSFVSPEAPVEGTEYGVNLAIYSPRTPIGEIFFECVDETATIFL